MGEYYYIEIRKDFIEPNVLHKSGCLRHTLLNEKMNFIGTFYRPQDAFLTAKKRFKSCSYCKRCCVALK